ncbi:SusC/RagA family TonB-linked outer membrane protein [Chitinophaga oryziterrae]|uniref:SusC/RagA family TonB-linked outer membrane protein n=1 Tax=Chitinophaga oryziterrae TaxID=1031224 RepID=A0A6N8J489_9BACT|nr:TonB-dependent receptor [Chitinophaga oryziterrae]MVT39511.1 SusC/RagA family TonB-linked outer membrane protein [Chitinophaga oryziterrae]
MHKKILEPRFRGDTYVHSSFLLRMKLILLLLTILFLQVKAETFGQKVTVIADKATLVEIIAQIRKQTDYDFLYNNQTLKDAKPITLQVRNMDIIKVLDRCFEGQPFEYTIKNKTVLILAKTNERSVKSAGGHQTRRILGSVRDGSNGEPLTGVIVGVEGTATGTSTNDKGAFSLEVPGPNSILVFSYIGFSTQKITVNDQTNIEVKMVRTDTKLDEVVVVGYGTKTKGAITGAISTVKADVFENRPLNNSFDALQGTIPGLTITKGSGQPGNQSYGLQVRGYSSINGSQPLVLVDGIPGDMNTINTNDIAEISVLKDAAASIYGARAANGVIIVTTKKGKKGPPEVAYSANVGIKNPTYLRKIQNTLQFAEFMDEGLRNAGIAGFSPDVFDKIRANAAADLSGGWNYGITNYPGFYGYTNWNKVIYKNSVQQMHNVAVSGGSENNNYLISLGYNRDEGSLKFGENKSERYNLRLNYDFRLSKKLSIETRNSFESQATVTPTMIGNALSNVTRQFPYQPVYNSVGKFYGYQGYENPAQSLEEGGSQLSNFSRISTNFKVDYSIIPSLKLTGQAAIRMDYNNDNGNTRTFTRYNYVGEIQDVRNTPNSAFYANQRLLNKLYQVYLDYNKQFGQDHSINFTGGASLEQTKVERQSTTGYNFIGNNIFTLNLADRTKAAYADFTGNLNNQALGSYFGRLSYSYKNKLILDLTARADGSSKFAPEKRWSAVFPSAALAYNLSEESFIKSLHTFELLKLRVSYGKMGNQELGNLGLYDYIPLISIDGNYPLGSPNVGVTGANANPASASRTWETIENRNIGIDVSVYRSRLSFSFDYFNKINNDMLVNIAVPATFGATPPSTNQGKVFTKGFETSLTWKDQINDFRYSISLQLSDSRNKLVELKNNDSYGEGLNYTRQGYPIYSYFGYVYDGIIRTQKQLDDYKQLQGIPSRIGIGDVMYKDVDGDGKLTAFGDKSKGLAGDMTYLGNLTPRYTYSSNITVGYKQFDLQVFLQGVGKRDVIYEGAISRPNAFYWPTLAYYSGKTWSPERPDAQYPRYLPGSVGYDDIRSYDYRASALTMHNVAYLRFKVITLGYNLSAGMLSRIRIKSARIFFSGQDLFTISKGTLGGNFDPEDGYRNEGTYPFNRVFSLGLNVKF